MRILSKFSLTLDLLKTIIQDSDLRIEEIVAFTEIMHSIAPVFISSLRINFSLAPASVAEEAITNPSTLCV